MNIIRTNYDKSYYENPLAAKRRRSQRDRAHLRIVLEHTQEGKLLELGCGKGGFLEVAQDHFKTQGIDISGYAAEQSRRITRAHVIHGDVEKIPIAPMRYDVIAAFGVLEHLKRPQQVISKIHDALLPGGMFVGVAPNNSGLVGKIGTAVMNLVDRTHCSSYSPKRWHALFVEAGFSRTSFFGEIAPTKDTCLLVHGRFWRHVSPNLMFACVK